MAGPGMPNQSNEPEIAERDGTSQAGRALDALEPSYVSVDEQTRAELLAFAREYSKELKYYGADGRQAGDWRGFIDPNLNLDDVVAFLEAPEKFSATTSPELFRPHFVLFLSFLQLLEKVRGEVNSLTARHLDFYYRQILRMVRKPSIPDRVNLVVELTPDGTEVLLPGKSLLNAGPDSLGRDRIYATDRDLVVNRTQLAKASSLLIDRRRTGLDQIKTRYANDKERACEAMFAIALGDPLLPYADGAAVNYAKLTSLRTFLKRAETDFFMPLTDIRDLMARIQLRPPLPAEWDEINAKLEIAGNKKRGGTTFKLDHTSRDFYTNLETAVGKLSFGTLPEVTRVDDLYDLRGRSDVVAFIHSALYFDNLDDFARMMQLKRKFENEWSEINRIIQVAGQRKRNDPSYQLAPTDVTAFAANLKSATGVDAAVLTRYWADVSTLENYFYMPAERFAFAMDEVIGADEQDWDQVFSILADANKEKLRSTRRLALQRMHEATPPARLIDLIRFVLGEDPDTVEDPTALDRLVPYLGQSDTDKLTKLAADNNWTRIYSLLELAQRNRLGEPTPEKVDWLNLYPAEDATKIQAHNTLESKDDSPRWVTFGLAQPLSNPTPTPKPVLGWALSSPLLVMNEGTRTITLTLGFGATQLPLETLFSKGGELPLSFEISTAKGWIPVAAAAPTFGAYATLSPGNTKGQPQGIQFVLTIATGADPVAALPPELVALGEIASPWPVLRLMMRPIWSEDDKQHRARYPQLGQLALIAAFIKVEVTGLKAIQLQNDEGQLDAKKPFEPFGDAPAVGSHFLLGHPELVGKKLDSLTFSFQWMGAPADVLANYANYGLPDGTKFTARIGLIDRTGETVLDPAAVLFGKNGADPVTLKYAGTSVGTIGAALNVGHRALLDGGANQSSELTEWKRYFQWELNAPDFQHANYPIVASSRAMAMAIDSAKGAATLDPTKYLVKPPYTPKLKSIALGYSSSLELRFDDLARDCTVHKVFHIHPFGYCDVEAERTSSTAALGLPFLPRYANDGELYIALKDLHAPQTVSIFFQMAEGSADPDVKAQQVLWSYLSGDRWQPLDRHILSDSTRSLINSGIIELALEPAAASTRLRGDYYWIRATVPQNTGSVCDIVGIHTQAVPATFVDHNNAPDHFREPLAAGTITQLAVAIPEIAGIHQPYTSYGGRMAEADGMFSTRVSERLRHKQRALTMWDYERLILNRFPELYKVKCIPARPDQPGSLTLIVIPDIRNKLPFDPFEPKAPSNLLADVREYLVARAPVFAAVDVRNAHYVSVRVRLGVRFRGAGNEEFYKQTLNDELNRFLSPWAYDEGNDIAIGGRIYASTIVDFVDRRPYVDYVAGIKLFFSDDGQSFRPVPRPAPGVSEGYFVGTQKPDAVLVAARAHQIDVLSEALYEEKLVTGINFMKLELDFTVAEG